MRGLLAIQDTEWWPRKWPKRTVTTTVRKLRPNCRICCRNSTCWRTSTIPTSSNCWALARTRPDRSCSSWSTAKTDPFGSVLLSTSWPYGTWGRTQSLIGWFIPHSNYLRRSRLVELQGVQGGNTETAAEEKRPITSRDILSFAWQISQAMTYLSESKVRPKPTGPLLSSVPFNGKSLHANWLRFFNSLADWKWKSSLIISAIILCQAYFQWCINIESHCFERLRKFAQLPHQWGFHFQLSENSAACMANIVHDFLIYFFIDSFRSGS